MSLMKTILLWLAIAALCQGQVQPIVSNVQASQRPGTKLVDISYNLSYSGGACTVWLDVSNDGGRYYSVPAKTFQGAIGQNVQPGNNRSIVWNAEADFDGLLADQMRVRVNVRAGHVPIPPHHMVYIPGGPFYMGDPTENSYAGMRSVYISPMFMDRFEVWGGLYNEVRDWGLENGYTDLEPLNNIVASSTHPVERVTFNAIIKWCNARSEREGLIPVYYADESHTTVYRTGDITNVNLYDPNQLIYNNKFVKWNANGYRIPTEAEWEKAARGGLTGKKYPWGDTIDLSMANYVGGGNGAVWRQFHPRTTPVGYFNGQQAGGGNDMANGYGLYDMVGNAAEVCWDIWSNLPSGETNPRGPNDYIWIGWSAHRARVVRGGSHTGSIENEYSNIGVRSANEEYQNNSHGFRCVRGL